MSKWLPPANGGYTGRRGTPSATGGTKSEQPGSDINKSTTADTRSGLAPKAPAGGAGVARAS